MGEANNIVNNIKVENVIFNCGSYNNLEKSLIKSYLILKHFLLTILNIMNILYVKVRISFRCIKF